MLDFFERYADRVQRGEPDACWPWTGAVASRGYGHTHRDGQHVYAHRAAYESAHGVGSADGLVVRHRCDNPPCCNPGHLLVGTHRDNALDCIERGRRNACYGERINTAVLTAAQVVEARRLRAETAATGVDLARRFGVSTSNMYALLLGQTWKHLLPANGEPTPC